MSLFLGNTQKDINKKRHDFSSNLLPNDSEQTFLELQKMKVKKKHIHKGKPELKYHLASSLDVSLMQMPSPTASCRYHYLRIFHIV